MVQAVVGAARREGVLPKRDVDAVVPQQGGHFRFVVGEAVGRELQVRVPVLGEPGGVQVDFAKGDAVRLGLGDDVVHDSPAIIGVAAQPEAEGPDLGQGRGAGQVARVPRQDLFGRRAGDDKVVHVRLLGAESDRALFGHAHIPLSAGGGVDEGAVAVGGEEEEGHVDVGARVARADGIVVDKIHRAAEARHAVEALAQAIQWLRQGQS